MPKASRGSHIRSKLAHRNEMLKLCGRVPCGTLTQAEKAWKALPHDVRNKAKEQCQN